MNQSLMIMMSSIMIKVSSIQEWRNLARIMGREVLTKAQALIKTMATLNLT